MAPPQLPNHVKKYLADMGVAESDLDQESLETFATLSGGEIALLRKLGNSLKGVNNTQVVAKVH
jgi:hypothetical protein